MLSRANQLRALIRPLRIRLARCYAHPPRPSGDLSVDPGRRKVELEDYKLAKELAEEYSRQGLDVRGGLLSCMV